MTDSVICRLAESQDMEQVKSLWSNCFDDTPTFVQWYFDRYFRAEHTMGIFSGTALLASAQVIPYRLQLRSSILDCGYVVGVDTEPEARNRGYARTLLLQCLQLQRERQQHISLLMPFEGQFYYRYGWPFCYFHQRIEICADELRCAAKRWGSVRQITLQEAAAVLPPIYQAFVQHYAGTVQRSEQTWKLLLEDAALEHTRCIIIAQESVPAAGYCLWAEVEDKIFVREMAWCHEMARVGLLDALMQIVPLGKKLWLELPDDDPLAYQLASAKKAVVRYPFLMARIVDVKQCLEAMVYPVNQIAWLRLAVKDDFAVWNNGIFDVKIQDGHASVTILEGESQQETDVTVTIEGLSQLVMGARSAEQLCWQNQLHANLGQLALLQQIWPVQNLYINEYY